jgi:hypothetical protein
MKKILVILMILVSSVTTFSQVTLTADSSYIKIIKSGQPTLFFFTRDAKLAYDNAYLYFSNKSGSVTWEYTLPYADISSYNGILKAAPGFPNFTTLKANLVACIKYGKASGGGGSGIAAWGYITGTLSDQTDLWNYIQYVQDSTDNPMYYSAGKIRTRLPIPTQYTSQYTATKYTITATAGTPNTATVNWNNGNVQYLVLLNASSTATTFTFSNPIDGGRYILILKQPASGTAATVTWDAKVLWSNGVTPVLTVTSSKVDIFSFIYDGTNDKYYGGNSFNY